MKAKPPTKRQRERWEALRAYGCMVCRRPAQIHHLFTGMGGRKDHSAVAPLCEEHHTGSAGLHQIGRKAFAARFMSEQEMQEKAEIIAPYL